MIMLPNDYLTIAKLWSIYSNFFPKFILGSSENRAPVVALDSFSETLAVYNDKVAYLNLVTKQQIYV